MADLHSDVIGQVARLPLKPSEANALLPLHEAVSNSLHAIHDRFGDKELAEKGRIDIEVVRGETDTGTFPVIGFVVTDNGIGLNPDNYRSFCTPFSQHKMKKGGKGVGRLGWLKVFQAITVTSRYVNDKGLQQIEFGFILREKNQIDLKEPPASPTGEPGTVVRMMQFLGAFGSRCPSKTDTIVQRIIGHFLPIFAGDKSPKIFLHDNGVIDVRDEFEHHPITVRHMKCDKSIRPRGSINNWMCFCANDRGVKEYGIDEQIGLKSLDGEQIYIGTVTGDYLDMHVNPQRTDFIFDAEEGRVIRRQVADSVQVFLKDYVDASLAHKKALTVGIITKNPQYLYLKSDLDDFVTSLQANSNNEEKIYVEMSQNRFRRQRRFNGVKKRYRKRTRIRRGGGSKGRRI